MKQALKALLHWLAVSGAVLCVLWLVWAAVPALLLLIVFGLIAVLTSE